MRYLPPCSVNFKEVWTSHIYQLVIDPRWTITQFIEHISPHISREFGTNDFDIVETGQNKDGIPSEEAPGIELSNIILKDKWSEKLNVSFYVRRKNIVNTPLQNTNISVNPNLIQECPVCLDLRHLIGRVGCLHRVCADCNNMCLSLNYTICPVCRHE